jgi:hypothetical protein
MAVKRYDGTAWQVVAGKGDQGTSSSISTWVKTASGGETSLSGNDDNSQALSYTVGQELVFINGTLLKRGSDYTATNGTSITGLTALAANDVATVWTVNAFSVTGAIANTIVDAKGDLLVGTAADTPGRLAVGTNGQVLTAASTTGTGLAWTTISTGITFSGCLLTNNGSQTIPNNTDTYLTYNTETYDTDGYHSTSSNTGRLTIPTGKSGYYYVYSLVRWDANSSGQRTMQITKNAAQDSMGVIEATPGGTSSYIGFHQGSIRYAAAGDYFECKVNQTSGGNLNVRANTNDCFFGIQYLGA